jgi:hypothetical protein
MPDKFIFLLVADDFHPVVIEQFELDLAFRKQAHELKQFFRGNRASAFFFDFGFTRRADAEFQVRGRDGERAALRFHQEIRKDGDRGLAFHNALRSGQFIKQRRLGYAEFH